MAESDGDADVFALLEMTASSWQGQINHSLHNAHWCFVTFVQHMAITVEKSSTGSRP